MSRTLLNGLEQIQAGTVPWSAMATGAIVPIASIVNGSQLILSTGAVAMGASLNAGGFAIQSVGAPVNTSDAATKIYVDDKVAGVGGIFFCQTIAVANVATLSALPTVDSYTMSAGQIVLLTQQTTASQNGPWVVGTGAWTRPAWWATGTTASPGSYFYIDRYGTIYGDTKWWMTTIGTITVDTTAIAFSQDQSGTTYSAGAGGGLTLTGGAFSVNTGNGITLSSGNVTAVGTGIISVSGAGIAISASSSNGQVILGNASNVPTWTTLSGDLTLSATGTATLATVNSNIGAFGSGAAIPVVTVNGKGLVTAASTTGVTAPAGALTGTTLAANVVSSSLTGLGTITSGVWTGSAVGIAYGGTGQTTATLGFNALSPLTTQGDLIYGGTAGAGTRLPIGTSAQVLIGGTTPNWGAVNLSTMASGTLQAAQHPALSGAITSTAGSLVTTLSAAAVALSNMASLTANSLIGNTTGSPATPAAVPIGTGVATALGNAVNGAGGAVLFSGSLGTPTQGVLSACTGYAAGSLTGLGTGVATALGTAAAGSSGGIVLATGPTVSGATLSGTTTISNAPIMSSLTGFLYGNAGSAVTASASLPSSALSMSVNEVPSGLINGSNTTYTLAHAPANSSLCFFLNGQLLHPGASYDYTVSSLTVTMNFAPASVDNLAANYFY
jgi:hypothetical protein